ncbi:MAG TPA: glycosyltransferase [Bryobacteraceae bacterium]|nr:glycosyltransferase [Bryobacteraceae bacterium]
MARVLFTALGSYGDLYPYLAIGVCLRGLGHEVTIASSTAFREKVESQYLDFAPIRPDISLENREMMAYLFHQRLGTERVLREVAKLARETYEDTLVPAEKADVVITHPITFASVLAVRKLRKPWISTVLAPMSLISAYDPPVPAPFPALVRLRKFGPSVMRAVWTLGKKASLPWVKPVLDLQRELGLTSEGHPLFEGANSPRLVLALFSRHFAEPQPDWPSQTVLTGFPLHSSSGDLAPELKRFLDDGPPPVVFTLGSSAVGAAGRFYADSLDAVTRLKVRAVFLTGRHPQGLPESLPAGLMAWPYAPHALVFARAAAIVHQGGIGTTAQGLMSGHPSLVVPFAHDQFDNAERVRRMHAGLSLPRPKYNARTAEEALRRLLHDKRYVEGAGGIAAKLRVEDGALSAARTIVEMLRR